MSKKIGEKKEHFSIRKLTVGAASVLIGTSLYLGGQKPATVHADPDDGSAKVTEVKTDQTDQKGQSVTEQDSKTSTVKSVKPATASGVKKEETKNSADENKKRATSEETNKGVQGSNQKGSDPTDHNEMTDALKDYEKPVIIQRTIRYHDENGHVNNTIVQKVTFGIFKAYVGQTDETAQTRKAFFIAYFAKPETDYNKKPTIGSYRIVDKKTFNEKDFDKEIKDFQDQLDKDVYQLDDYRIQSPSGYYDKVVTQSGDPNLQQQTIEFMIFQRCLLIVKVPIKSLIFTF